MTTGVDARHASPKVTVSRLITGDDGGRCDHEMAENAGNSVEPNSDF